MTLEESVLKVIDKLKSLDGKMLGFAKRLKKLEEDDSFKKEYAEEMVDRLKKLEEKEDAPCFESEGGFVPNSKFMSWYSGVFADPIIEELNDEVQEEPAEEVEDISPEVLEKLDEVIIDG